MKLLSKHINLLKQLSNTAKGNILKMTTVAKSGHPGGAISSLDLFLVTFMFSNVFLNENYFEEYFISQQKWNDYVKKLKFKNSDDIDSFFISNGHVSAGWYAVLELFGIFDEDICNSGFRKIDSPYTGHVEKSIPYISWDTGSLGQGLSAACGKALYYKKMNYKSNIWVFMGDGEQQKGQISEARRFIKKFDLDNINIIIDNNELQINGNISDIMYNDIRSEYKSSKFIVTEINGHDYNEILDSIIKAKRDKKNPHMILAKTISGNGISFMQNNVKYVSTVLSDDECQKALKELKINNNLDELRKIRCTFDYSQVKLKEPRNNHNISLKDLKLKLYRVNEYDCKVAYVETLLEIIKYINIPVFVFDCDLAKAVKTDLFEKKYPNNFIQCGIQEHHTVTCAGAMSMEQALVFYSDFAVFGLYEPYNQHNLNILNNTNLKIVLTHTGLVGEDGKTHHCSNYIGVINSLFNSKLILPIDANQTKHIIKYISENQGNFFVCLSRNVLPIIHNENNDILYDEDYIYEYGNFDIIHNSNYLYVISTGPIFAEVYQAIQKLRKEKYNVGLINISSPLFINRNIVNILHNKKVLIIEDHNKKCGLYFNLISILYEENELLSIKHIGLESFCNSGSYNDLLKKNRLDKNSIVEYIKDEYYENK